MNGRVASAKSVEIDPQLTWGNSNFAVQRSPTGYLSEFRTIQVCPKDFAAGQRDTPATASIVRTVRAEGRENMDPRWACSNSRNDARLFYFAAAVPTVGFVHGAAHLTPLDEAAPESNVEITERRRGIPFLHRHAWLAA
jgi:hypothetical protein